MSSIYELPGPDGLEQLSPEPAPARARLRVVPDVPLDFDAAVLALRPRLVRYATRRLGDAHEAEEVVQEALLRAFKQSADLLTEDDLAAWSTCVTGRLVIDRLRVRGRSTSVAEVPEGTRMGRDTADVVVARDEARTALDALDAMPPRQAAVLWAREVEGLAYDEIGARFGMTEPAVRSILTRARKALRKEYETRGGTLPAGGLAAIAPWADGLGWLERLRGAMGRIVAPAGLSVMGIGILGGTLLLPGLQPVTTAPPSVASTVVTLVDTPVALHGTVAPTTPAAKPAGAAASASAPTATRVGSSNTASIETVKRITDSLPCSRADLPSSTLPVSGPVGAGSGECEAGRQSTTYVNKELPVVGYVGVTTDERCEKSPLTTLTPTQGVIACDNEQDPANGGTQ